MKGFRLKLKEYTIRSPESESNIGVMLNLESCQLIIRIRTIFDNLAPMLAILHFHHNAVNALINPASLKQRKLKAIRFIKYV